jgi:hypothetical protein
MPLDKTNPPPVPAMVASAPQVSDFHLQFTLASGVLRDSGLYQWTSVVTLPGRAAPRCSMLLTRNNGDMIGAPVGLFSDSLRSEDARRLVERLDGIAAANQAPAGNDGRPFKFRINYEHSTLRISSDFNPQNVEFFQAMTPVIQDLQVVMSQLMDKPDRALVVSVDKGADSAGRVQFTMRLTNVGVADVIVADPRLTPPGAPGQRAFFKVAPSPVDAPGQMPIPPRWLPLGLEPARQGVADIGLLLKPRESVSILSIPWSAPRSGEYVVQAVWEDYRGPGQLDPLAVQPPVPKSAEPDPKPFVMRGAAFSKYLTFSVNTK